MPFTVLNPSLTTCLHPSCHGATLKDKNDSISTFLFSLNADNAIDDECMDYDNTNDSVLVCKASYKICPNCSTRYEYDRHISGNVINIHSKAILEGRVSHIRVSQRKYVTIGVARHLFSSIERSAASFFQASEAFNRVYAQSLKEEIDPSSSVGIISS